MRNYEKLDLSQGQHLQLKGAQAGEITLLAEGKDAWLTSLHFPIRVFFFSKALGSLFNLAVPFTGIRHL